MSRILLRKIREIDLFTTTVPTPIKYNTIVFTEYFLSFISRCVNVHITVMYSMYVRVKMKNLLSPKDFVKSNIQSFLQQNCYFHEIVAKKVISTLHKCLRKKSTFFRQINVSIKIIYQRVDFTGFFYVKARRDRVLQFYALTIFLLKIS